MVGRLAAVFAGALLIIAGSDRLVAAQIPSLTLTVEPARLEFLGTGEGQTVRVTVSGGSAGVVTLTLYDAIADAQGRWREEPYGTSDATLAGTLALSPTSFRYDPGDAPQVFEALARLPAGPVDRPRVGSLIVTVGPEITGGALVVQQAAVQVQVLATPDAVGVGVLPPGSFSLDVGDITVRQGRPFSPIDRLLPDLPRVVGRGPISTSVRVSNLGTAIVDARVNWEFDRVGPLGLFSSAINPTPYVRVGLSPRYVLPGQRFTSEGSSTARFDAGPLDAMPFIGLVRIVAKVEATLGDVPVASGVATRTVFVFPWGEALAIGLVWLGVRRLRRRTIDLRYANEPIDASPGTHRRSKWWRLTGGERGATPPRRAAERAAGGAGERVRRERAPRATVEQPKRRLLRDLTEEEILELARSERPPGRRKPFR